ncbi:6140_t:CDS:2 [Funneliformis geosporum]|uniref:6140_t:CDS:1 n=1 Tax=Funneliformis geosporum TaxID=1117311 RepID=A0A9W4T3D2_9GLOM|nr:6140_t:CDS:2 [Funneliformis geosporum]
MEIADVGYTISDFPFVVRILLIKIAQNSTRWGRHSNDPLQILNNPKTIISDVHLTTPTDRVSLGALSNHGKGTLGAEIGTGKWGARVSSSLNNNDFKYTRGATSVPKFVAGRIIMEHPSGNTGREFANLRDSLRN